MLKWDTYKRRAGRWRDVRGCVKKTRDLNKDICQRKRFREGKERAEGWGGGGTERECQ